MHILTIYQNVLKFPNVYKHCVKDMCLKYYKYVFIIVINNNHHYLLLKMQNLTYPDDYWSYCGVYIPNSVNTIIGINGEKIISIPVKERKSNQEITYIQWNDSILSNLARPVISYNEIEKFIRDNAVFNQKDGRYYYNMETDKWITTKNYTSSLKVRPRVLLMPDLDGKDIKRTFFTKDGETTYQIKGSGIGNMDEDDYEKLYGIKLLDNFYNKNYYRSHNRSINGSVDKHTYYYNEYGSWVTIHEKIKSKKLKEKLSEWVMDNNLSDFLPTYPSFPTYYH